MLRKHLNHDLVKAFDEFGRRSLDHERLVEALLHERGLSGKLFATSQLSAELKLPTDRVRSLMRDLRDHLTERGVKS